MNAKNTTALATKVENPIEIFSENLKKGDIENISLSSLLEIQSLETKKKFGANHILLRDGRLLLVQGAEEEQDFQFLKILQAHEYDKAQRGEVFDRKKIKIVDFFGEDDHVMQKLIEVAMAISSAGTGFPSHLKGNAALCQFVATSAYKYGLDPFALAANHCYQVNGRNEFFGTYHEDLIKKFAPIVGGLLHFHIEGNFNELIIPNNDFTSTIINSPNHAITVYALCDNGNLLKLRISMAMLNKTNSVLWKTNPLLQLKYFSTRIFLKMFFSGLYNSLDNEREEIETPTIFTFSPTFLEAEVKKEFAEVTGTAPVNNFNNSNMSYYNNEPNNYKVVSEDSSFDLQDILKNELQEQIFACQNKNDLDAVVEVLKTERDRMNKDTYDYLSDCYKAKKEELGL